MKRHVLLILLAVAACGSSKHVDGVPCDAKTISDLKTSLDKANGYNVDLTNAQVKADIETAKKAVFAKKFAFTSCKFASQGNDIVSFSSFADGGKSIECTMKNGEKGVTEFRHAAMAIGQDKLKLDVSGTIGEYGSKDFRTIGMTDCEISTHE